MPVIYVFLYTLFLCVFVYFESVYFVVLQITNSVQSCRGESRPKKLKCSLFNSLNVFKYDYGRRTDSFKDR